MSQKNNIAIILLVAFIGFAAGFAGHLVAGSYSLVSSYGLPFYGDLNLADGHSSFGLVIRNANTVIVKQDTAVSQATLTAKDFFMGVFKRVQSADDVDAVNVINEYYNLNSQLTELIAITSDGWLVGNNKDVFADDTKDLVVIDSDKKIYDIEKVVSDDTNDLVFIKLIGASNIPVAVISEEKPESGQMVVGVNWNDGVIISSIIGVDRKNGVKASDSFADTVNIDKSDEGSSCYLNLEGAITAIRNVANEYIPSYRLKLSVNKLLKGEELSNTVFGVNYLDVSELAPLYNGMESGALIIANKEDKAVLKDSPAARAGFMAGDIILEVDNIKISGDADLARHIQKYSTGDSISVLYMRNGKEIRVDVVL